LLECELYSTAVDFGHFVAYLSALTTSKRSSTFDHSGIHQAPSHPTCGCIGIHWLKGIPCKNLIPRCPTWRYALLDIPLKSTPVERVRECEDNGNSESTTSDTVPVPVTNTLDEDAFPTSKSASRSWTSLCRLEDNSHLDRGLPRSLATRPKSK
jgi:hypothetical protein